MGYKIIGLDLSNFTLFHDKFHFANGINVIIGQNGTGKTHLLKVLYAAARSAWKNSLAQDSIPTDLFFTELLSVFDLNSKSRSELVSNFSTKTDDDCFVVARFEEDGARSLSSGKTLYAKISTEKQLLENPNTLPKNEQEPVFIRSIDVLALQPGLAYNIDRRTIRLDSAYRDLANQIDGNIVEKPCYSDIVLEIEKLIEGKLVRDGNTHIFQSDTRKYPLDMVADGHKKLALLGYLLANDTIRNGSILFWDEPENSLNPVLITKTVEILHKLSAAGVQIFVATHDFLTANEFGLIAEYGTTPKVKIKFIALNKNGNGPTTHTESDQLSGIEPNDILDEFISHYHREANAFKKFARGGHA